MSPAVERSQLTRAVHVLAQVVRRDLGSVALTRSQFNNAQITALAFRVTRTQLFQNLVDRGFDGQISAKLAT